MFRNIHPARLFDLIEAIIAAIARRDFEAATALVPDAAIEAFGVAGTPTACRDGLEHYLGAGLEKPSRHI